MTATLSAASPSPAGAPDASSSVNLLLSSYLPSSSLKSRLNAHADALLEHRVRTKTRRQVDQLRGELRDDFRTRASGLKADWMARVVPEDEGGEDDDDSEVDVSALDLGRGPGSTHGDDTPSPRTTPPGPPRDSTPLQPTIISDTDGAAEMAKRVDATVEEALAAQVDEARERIEASVRRSEAMELELWLGNEVRLAQSSRSS
ncbi:hypothetical protein DMC30DRAFT_402140 [Rhodotorula diobovata]|uniref:Uncharacterized protein n=1 Tax=Rhodotorula diobovata TaxID=5288 RepID=A0A5C5FPN5_9BASI|nr:hypothetical protein DMC30DRAFT_402140 [Rhodotorula diobovata]